MRRRSWVVAPCVGCLLLCLTVLQGRAQLLMPPASSSAAAPPQNAIPLSHYYWFFLRHQLALDHFADERAAEGKDGGYLRNELQAKLGFTDAEYTPIRVAAGRLSSEIGVLDGKASEVQKGEPIPAVREADLKELAAEREQDIQAEVTFLKQSLPPEKIATLESFVVHLFAPKTTPNPLMQLPIKETR